VSGDIEAAREQCREDVERMTVAELIDKLRWRNRVSMEADLLDDIVEKEAERLLCQLREERGR
jgi:hypothetical protein